MTIVTEYDWESDTWTHPTGEHAARAAWREAVQAIAERAKTTLPECHGRVDAAVKLVLAGDVELLDDTTAKVASQSQGTTKYFVVNGGCTCPDFAKAPSNWCKHRIAAGLYKRATVLVQRKLAQDNGASHGASHGRVDTPPVPQPDMPAPIAAQAETSGVPEGLKPYMVTLHGKPFVRYAGLLALAHERGLVQLTARIEFHSDALVLASATATFQDGRVFAEWADATPENVGFQVRPHWVRMALTRAKSRCLRDALQIGIAALEELADE
jgi:hypothetical protein